MGVITALSVVIVILSMVLVPLIIILIPSDYFIHQERKKVLHYENKPILDIISTVLKNIVGVIFIVAGIIMLFTPGQGVLTIFAGLLLVDFPNKYKYEKRLLKKEKVLKTINWIRTKAGREPLRVAE